MSALPRGWVESALETLCISVSDGDHQAPPKASSGVPFITISSIWNGRIDLENATRFVPLAYKEALEPSRDPQRGDIVLSVTGSIGRSAIVENPSFVFQRHIALIKAAPQVEQKYLCYFFTSGSTVRHLEELSTGTAQKTLPLSKLRKVSIPLPPLAEQKRIVAKLDALNAKSARARTELARIETLVSRYKQAVLRKAFSGELTLAAEDAELRGDDGVSYPRHWRQMQLGQIAEIKSGITLGKKRKPDEQLVEVPYLRVANVQRGWLDLREMKTVEVTTREAEALFLREGDVLMNEGGDRDKLGRGWVWDGQIVDCIHQNHVFRVRLAPEIIPARFLSYYANEFGQKHFFDEGKQTTNLASISKSKLSAMTVPVPPFEEAKEIVRRIESAFAKIDRLAKESKRALELVGKLDEAILTKAFRGELVPQDENDEPAGLLLERIRQARSGEPPRPRRRASATKEKVHDMARTIVEALTEARDWLETQDLFALCGVRDGSSTEDVELLYRQLLDLERMGRIDIKEVVDPETGSKQGNMVRLQRG